jgi:hypothetical protein
MPMTLQKGLEHYELLVVDQGHPIRMIHWRAGELLHELKSKMKLGNQKTCRR